MAIPSVSAPNFVSISPLMNIFVPCFKEDWSILNLVIFLSFMSSMDCIFHDSSSWANIHLSVSAYHVWFFFFVICFLWLGYLHIKQDTLKLKEEKVGESLKHIGTGENLLNKTPMTHAQGSRINKWDLIKLQSFCKAKDTVSRTNWQPTDWEKIFTNPTSDRDLISKIYKELKTLDSRELNNPI